MPLILQCLLSPRPPSFLLRSSSKPEPITEPGSDRPARDRVIDFGKHKGRMLGSLPSDYLRWASRTLRARDSLEWARLADRVLSDPVYADRIEWESADRVLTGASRSESPARDLLEIGARFGWDLADCAAWARLDFALLGTSRGGRIPRLRRGNGGETAPKEDGGENASRLGSPKKLGIGKIGSFREGGTLGNDGYRFGVRVAFPERNEIGSLGKKRLGSSNGDPSGGKVGSLRKGSRFVVENEVEEVEEGEDEVVRRRRERRRVKRGQQLEMVRREVGVEEEETNKRGIDGGLFVAKGVSRNGETVVNPFPGRRALLDKISRRKQGD